MTPYRILLAEDHALVREGIKRILERNHGLELIGEVGDGLELLEFLKKTVPDLIILDISMPNLNGLEALEKIKAKYPRVKVLMLTMHKSKERLIQAFSAGADGYLLKGNVYGDLFSALEKIRHGGHYISNLMSNQIVDLIRETPGQLLSDIKLSPREEAVLQLISQGKTMRQIANHLSLALPTVHNHRTRLKKKLNVSSDAGLIRYAFQKGYAKAEGELAAPEDAY